MTDSFDEISAWLRRQGDDPAAGDIQEIREYLEDVHRRLLNVRMVSPTVDLTDRMWLLMQRAGLEVKKYRSRKGFR